MIDPLKELQKTGLNDWKIKGEQIMVLSSFSQSSFSYKNIQTFFPLQVWLLLITVYRHLTLLHNRRERFNVHELLHRLSGVVNRVQYSWEK